MQEMKTLRNKQTRIAGIFWLLAVVFGFTVAAAFMEGTPVSGNWPLAFVSIFLTLSCMACAIIFGSRAKKMAGLLSGEKLLVRWRLDEQMLADFVRIYHAEATAKSKAIMVVVTVLFGIITVPFLFFLEGDERSGFLLIMGSILFVVFCASRFFPWYYRVKNQRGDRQVLIGAKYAYINGYLHNWDFPLSGLNKVKCISKPFRGLHLSYYYTDRTFRHSHDLRIPVPADIDLQHLVATIRTQA